MDRLCRVAKHWNWKFPMSSIAVAWLVILTLPNVIVAQDRVKFPVGVGTKTLGTGLIWLATKKGFFDEFNLDVQPVLLRGTPVAVQALVGESLYLTMGSADAMASAAVGGADLVSVAGVINGLTQAIVAGKKYKSFKESARYHRRCTNRWLRARPPSSSASLKRMDSTIPPTTSFWR